MDIKGIKFAFAYARLDDVDKACREVNMEVAMGQLLLRQPEVVAIVKCRQSELNKAAMINSESVLAEWYDIVQADINKVIKILRVNCRYCNGDDNKYQWTQQEFNIACESAMLKNISIPDNSGGMGYNPWATPNILCTECGGVGEEKVFVESLDNVPDNVKKSVSSIEVKSGGGIKISFRDKDKAIENIAKYLGMFIERKEIMGNLSIKKNVEELTDEELLNVIENSSS